MAWNLKMWLLFKVSVAQTFGVKVCNNAPQVSIVPEVDHGTVTLFR